MPALQQLSRDANIPLIEDCAQAHGATLSGTMAGRWGVLSTWSFYPAKNLGALGDGGAVVTDDPELAERLKRLRNYGQRVRYYHDEEGRNSRLDEMQAAILRVKLRHLPRWNQRRREIADYYDRELAHTPIHLPAILEDCIPVRHLYPIRVQSSRRNALREYLENKGIGTQIHYPVPLHQQKAYSSYLKASLSPMPKPPRLSFCRFHCSLR